MKIKSNILLLSLLVVLFSSCDEFLEVEPITEITKEQAALEPTLSIAGSYEPMRWEFMDNLGDAYTMAYIYTDVRSDDVILENHYFQPANHPFETLSLQATNVSVKGVWEKFFTGVRRSNDLLASFNSLTPDVTPQEQIDALKGEARFLRAYYYFELVKNFGDVPLFTEDSYTDDIDMSRKPASEVYSLIIEDLTFAAQGLPVNQGESWRATKGAAYGLLAKVYLYNGQWQNAADAAEEVIALNVYGLESNYADNFSLSNEFGTESVFELNYEFDQAGGAFTRQNKGSLTAQFFSPWWWFPLEGWSYNLVEKELQDAFDAEGDAIRKDATIIEGGTFIESQAMIDAGNYPVPADFLGWWANNPDVGGQRYGDGFAYSRKYYLTHEEIADEASNQINKSPLNHKVLRYAEILLIHAEAVAMGANGDGQSSLDAVRARVGLPSKALSLEAVKLERRLELATEWNRFHDLVRWGDAASEIDGFTVGKDELLPIPFDEIQLVGGNILTQNPGYN